MTRGRKPLPPAEATQPINAEATRDSLKAADTLAAMHDAANDNAQALAVQLGYEGSMTVGALEDEIRFYQRRTVEACLELGKRLLILKELTPHGEFKQRVELLDISYKMAYKFMASTLKFSKVSPARLLASAGTQSKLLELLTLDDGEIEALENGDSARGITLDDIDTMSAKELRAALRESKEDAKAVERLLADKNSKIDELAKKGKKRTADPWPEDVDGFKNDLHGIGKHLDALLSQSLTNLDVIELETDKYAEAENTTALTAYKTVIHQFGAHIERLCTLAAGLRNEFETRLGGYVDLDKTYVLPE